MITRIYKLGNNVAIEENSEIVMLIPSRSLRIEPEADFICIHDLEVQRTRNILYGNLQDQNGVSLGSKLDVINYLSPLVGFDNASTASATIWGDITGNIADQTDLENFLLLKVDTVVGKQLSDENFTLVEKNKLTSITAIFTSSLKVAYDNVVIWVSTNGNNILNHLTNTSNPHNVTASQVGAYTTSQVDSSLLLKVNKISGKSLSTNDYTTVDKNKLDSLSNYTGFRGAQSSLPNIITSYPTAVLGDWAIITNPTGNAYFAIYDTDINTWVSAGQSPTIPGTNLSYTVLGNVLTINSDTGNDVTMPLATITATGLLSKEDKTKLDSIASNATANSSDSSLRDRSTHTGTQLASTISDFTSTVNALLTIFKTTNFLDATSSIQTQINNKQNLDVLITLNVNVSSVSITPVDTGLNVNLVAGKKYKLSFFGNHQTVALTTGVRIGFIAPTGTYNVIGTLKGIVNLGTANTELHTSIHSINTSSATAGSFILTTSVGAANTPSYIGGDLYIECITSGQIRLQIATEVNASSAQLNAGSTIILKQLN